MARSYRMFGKSNFKTAENLAEMAITLIKDLPVQSDEMGSRLCSYYDELSYIKFLLGKNNEAKELSKKVIDLSKKYTIKKGVQDSVKLHSKIILNR